MNDGKREQGLRDRFLLWLLERGEVGTARLATEDERAKGVDAVFTHNDKEFTVTIEVVMATECRLGFVPYWTIEEVYDIGQGRTQPPVISRNLMPSVFQADYIAYVVGQTEKVYIMFPRGFRELVINNYKDTTGFIAERTDDEGGRYMSLGLLIPVDWLKESCMMQGDLPPLPGVEAGELSLF